jgi:hypothetical protein
LTDSIAGRVVPQVLEPRVELFAPRTLPDERAARRSTWPRKGFDWGVPGRAGPRLLSLGELEELRDDLAERVATGRAALSDRTYVEEQNRCLIEEMLLEPERHKWVRVGNEDIGEGGCKHWHVQPRWGLLGMLLNWWRVRISSGCPLAT